MLISRTLFVLFLSIPCFLFYNFLIIKSSVIITSCRDSFFFTFTYLISLFLVVVCFFLQAFELNYSTFSHVSPLVISPTFRFFKFLYFFVLYFFVFIFFSVWILYCTSLFCFCTFFSFTFLCDFCYSCLSQILLAFSFIYFLFFYGLFI